MNLILGAGIAGISAAYHLALKNCNYTLCEKNNSWGGLCDNFNVNGFQFDYFVHLSFTTDDYVKNLFAQSADFYTHKPISYNYYKGKWIKHPAQNNLAQLPTNEKVEIIQDFVNKPTTDPHNYYEWLVNQFGYYFTNQLANKYTKKYWTVDAENLGLDWVNGRFSLPDLKDVLKGAFDEQPDNFYYAKEMRYPKIGGFKAFLNKMAEAVDINLNKKAVLIDPKHKFVEFQDGTKTYYSNLISSIPLPVLINIIKDCPNDVRSAGSQLVATEGQLVSIGFNKANVAKYLWAYVYDEDIEIARIYSPSIKSVYNTPNVGQYENKLIKANGGGGKFFTPIRNISLQIHKKNERKSTRRSCYTKRYTNEYVY